MDEFLTNRFQIQPSGNSGPGYSLPSTRGRMNMLFAALHELAPGTKQENIAAQQVVRY